jgi:hypothetical protein
MNRTETFQSLSHRFVLRSNDDRLADRAHDLIAEFATPLGDGGAGAPGDIVYSLAAGTSANGEPSFSLTRGDEEIARSGDERAVIGQLLWRITDDTVMLAKGYLLIHSGAVVAPAGDAVLILGEAGSGKTTLVAALVQEGFGYLSDEAGAIEIGTGVAHPWARPLGFTAGARGLPRFASLFATAGADDSEDDKAHVKVERIRSGAIAAPSRIRHVIDHRFTPGAQTSVEPLTRATAVARMGSAAPRLREEGARGLTTLVDLMRGARAHAIVSGDIDTAVAAVIGVAAR